MIALLISWARAVREAVSEAMALRREMIRKHGVISE
jgi:hypothetical protein